MERVGLIFCAFTCSVLSLQVAFVGMAGMGKSSLVQHLCQTPTSVSHQGDGTLQIETYYNCTKYGWTIYDTPGYGTSERSETRPGPITFDIAVVCLGPRIYTQDDYVIETLLEIGKKVVLARTRCDIFPCDQNTLLKLTMDRFKGAVVFCTTTNMSHPSYEGVERMIDFIQSFERK